MQTKISELNEVHEDMEINLDAGTLGKLSSNGTVLIVGILFHINTVIICSLCSGDVA